MRFSRWAAERFDLRNLVISHNANQAIFHCCVQKTGSQWIRSVLCDRGLYHFHGLKSVCYDDSPTSIPKASVPPIYNGTIHVQYYIDFPTYRKMAKPNQYKTFYIFRDPRDIVVSWYFSARNTHKPRPSILAHREILQSVGRREGIEYSIRHLYEYGLFETMASWIDADKDDPNVLICYFEDLIKDDLAGFRTIFQHCGIKVPMPVLKSLISRHSFLHQTGGRAPGQEDRTSHLRKGSSGDWLNYFDTRLQTLFTECAGDLVRRLRYET
jgi:hypothetical protein